MYTNINYVNIWIKLTNFNAISLTIIPYTNVIYRTNSIMFFFAFFFFGVLLVNNKIVYLFTFKISATDVWTIYKIFNN